MKVIRVHGGFGEEETIVNAVVETFDGKGNSKLESVRYHRPARNASHIEAGGPARKEPKPPPKRMLTPEDWKKSQDK